jgi:hypothetical protein
MHHDPVDKHRQIDVVIQWVWANLSFRWTISPWHSYLSITQAKSE